MRLQYDRTEDRQTRRNRIIVVAVLAVVFFFLVIEGCWIGNMIAIFISDAEAEEMDGYECFVICQPDGLVNIRSKPKKSAAEIGWATCGTRLLTNGKIRNGYLFVYDLAAEVSTGWISVRYITEEQPKEIGERMVIRAEGRVACRKWMDGKIVKWYRDGDQVMVHWMADGWAVTDRGYIRYEYLESLY